MGRNYSGSQNSEFGSQVPRPETYGLSPQFRRAAVSIAANIAEGFKKRGKSDKLRFYRIAPGSIEESRHYLIPAKDLEYGDVPGSSQLLEEVSKLTSESCLPE